MGYSQPGLGKTSFFAQFPSVMFVHDPDERGVNILLKRGLIPKPAEIREVKTYNELCKIGNKEAHNLYKKGIRTVVYDSATGFERICQLHHCQENYNGDWSEGGFLAYQRGPKATARHEWSEWITSLDDLISAGIDVCVICHSQVKPYANPVGPDYDRFTPYLDKESWQFVHRWAQAVLFFNYEYDVERKKGAKPDAKGKAVQGSQMRMMYTEWSPAWDAKNQFGLPEAIDMGSSAAEAYENFVAAFKQ